MLALIPMRLLLPGLRANLRGFSSPVPSEFDCFAPFADPPAGDALQSRMRESFSAKIPSRCI
jgi:hypothetical protein